MEGGHQQGPSPPGSASVKPLLILATTGTTGDMLPFLTLGQGLQARGHRVLMVVPRFHAALFEQAGLSCHPLG
ncbi:glycosyltransferase, partial [Vibrio parahaemolyticus]